MPVGLPKPKRCTQRSNFRAPSLRPIITEPTFEDWARMSDTAQRHAAAVVRLPDHPVRHADLRRQVERGVGLDQALSWSAPDTVNALKVEPGS